MNGKRFINDIDDGQLIDTKGELSDIDYSDKVDFYELWEFLNKLNDENEQCKMMIATLLEENQQLKQELEEYRHEDECITEYMQLIGEEMLKKEDLE